MPRKKEILLSEEEYVPKKRGFSKFVTFEFKGPMKEINELIEKANQAGTKIEKFPKDPTAREIFQLKILFQEKQFCSFVDILKNNPTNQ